MPGAPPPAPEAPPPGPPDDGGPARGVRAPLAAAALTTAAVVFLSWTLPEEHAATGVGLAFLTTTYFLTLRGGDPAAARAHGLSLGGLLDLEPIAPGRLAREAATELCWAAFVAAVVFPPFWLGWLWWWNPRGAFEWGALASVLSDAPGQLLVIALPEEAFYRGYLQTRLDRALGRPRVLLGVPVGTGLLVTSAVFALGHLLTEPHPSRLAVFFPSLLFGWLRLRRGGIGGATLLHAGSNLFATFLARSYGLSP